MLSTFRFARTAVLTLAAACVALPAGAQTAGNQGAISLTGGIDFVNAYMFRGLLQDDTRMIMWPYAEATARLRTAPEGLRTIAVHVGTWNSLHTGATGTALGNKLWYESDFYSTLALGFGGGFSVGTTFTVYTSPNDSFSTVKELAVKVALDDSDATLAPVALRPYALVAFELDTAPGIGQADIGTNGGTYLEVGAAPGWVGGPVNISFPIKLGISLNDYYELAGVDHQFGYLSIAAIGTLPLDNSRRFGNWNLHGGVEFQSLGDTPEAFNRGDQTKLIASIGIGFTY